MLVTYGLPLSRPAITDMYIPHYCHDLYFVTHMLPLEPPPLPIMFLAHYVITNMV